MTIAELRAALLRYGRHEQFCKAWHENRGHGTRWTVDEDCDCGLTKACSQSDVESERRIRTWLTTRGPWRAEGQFVIRADGTSVCRVNGMESDAALIAEAVNAKHPPASGEVK